jgi:predicted ATP-grasp superfamily ATP-dependent carboligase
VPELQQQEAIAEVAPLQDAVAKVAHYDNSDLQDTETIVVPEIDPAVALRKCPARELIDSMDDADDDGDEEIDAGGGFQQQEENCTVMRNLSA